jgi:hypothetical protein
MNTTAPDPPAGAAYQRKAPPERGKFRETDRPNGRDARRRQTMICGTDRRGIGRQQPGVGISISRMSGFIGRQRDDAPDGTAGAARCRRHGPIGIGVKLTPCGRGLSIAGYA